jgi:hypothetical protein
MFLYPFVLSRLPALGGLVVAAALLLAAGPASAQQPGYGPPPGASKMWPWNVGWVSPPAAAARPAAPTPSPAARRAPAGPPPHWDGTLLVVVARPAPARTAPLTVNLRGPDGVARSFPVEGGPSASQTREVIVRPGSTATVNLPTSHPR